VEQRAHDAAGDGHRADGVAEGRRGWWGNAVGVWLLQPHGDAGAAPVRERVVRTAVSVGPALALPGAAHVDDVRVVCTDVVDVDLELRPDARELVREEHVACRGEPVEDLEAVVGAEVEAEALLAAVRVLEQHVHLRPHDAREPARREAPHGIAALDVLDLDDLGAPVRQQRRCGRHERVLGDFENANPLHHCGHGALPRVCRSI
jgi:hypothetical protein